MAYGSTTRRGGIFYRVAEPGWDDPLDTSYSMNAGGRWNAAGSFGVLYLNATVQMARLQVQHKLAGQPYGVEDLEESEQHDLASIELDDDGYLDCVSDDGLAGVGLPTTCPRAHNGDVVPWPHCQAAGQRAYDDGLPGIAYRSAATGAGPQDEELAGFENRGGARLVERRRFAAWYWGH